MSAVCGVSRLYLVHLDAALAGKVTIRLPLLERRIGIGANFTTTLRSRDAGDGIRRRLRRR